MDRVEFKSWPKYWIKEKNGLKPNTVRILGRKDPRKLQLLEWSISGKYGKIRMMNSRTRQKFTRQITDATFYDSKIIISWKHKERRKK